MILVMAGLVPAIHHLDLATVTLDRLAAALMDSRHKAGNDGRKPPVGRTWASFIPTGLAANALIPIDYCRPNHRVFPGDRRRTILGDGL